MYLKIITDIEDRMFYEAIKLYNISFPYHEQRNIISQKEILSDSDYHFSLVYDEDSFIGIILYWQREDFIYIEHFCILPEMRNKQYGQKVLNILKEKNKTLILEIDPPIDTLSLRRKEFYERCGFVENTYLHIHPPYHKGNSGHELILMSFPYRISKKMFDDFSLYLKERVMRNVFK